jgi:hypothetical protein
MGYVPESDIDELMVSLDGTEEPFLSYHSDGKLAVLNFGALKLIFNSVADYEGWCANLPTKFDAVD